jgi:hypothetical protein
MVDTETGTLVPRLNIIIAAILVGLIFRDAYLHHLYSLIPASGL